MPTENTNVDGSAYGQFPPTDQTFQYPAGTRLATKAEFDSKNTLVVAMLAPNGQTVWVKYSDNATAPVSQTPRAAANKEAVLPTITVSATRISSILVPKPGPPIPNPMHKFASWTYSVSLWWLGLEDYARLMAQEDVDGAMAFAPTKGNSFVLAEDGGIYPNQRVPNTLGVNYNIQSVSFTTTIAPGRQNRSTNMIEGKITIVEPYGVTFIDSLVLASFDGTRHRNYTQQPLMLQIDFKGYDDDGKPVPADQLALYRKRFPIRILTCKLDVSSGGSQYDISFTATGAVAHMPEMATTPKDFNITAGTVREFFDQLGDQITQFNVDYILKGKAAFADGLKFDYDDKIGDSKIVDELNVKFTEGNPSSKKIDFKKKRFSIPAKTSMIDIVTKVLSQSNYFIVDQKLGRSGAINTASTNLTTIFNYFKMTSEVKYIGVSADRTAHENVFDPVRNTLPQQVTLKIRQYPTWSGKHPLQNNQLADPRPYSIKKYNYLFTGKNTDVVDFKLEFNSTYYTAMLAYTSAVPATNISKSTKDENELESLGNAGYVPIVTPVVLGNFIPGMLTTPNPTPNRIVPQANDASLSAGLLNQSDAVKVADVTRSIYSGLTGDMVAVTLTIVGDPTLIKQDDWLYIPSPSRAALYNDIDGTNQADFATNYGHVRTDTGELIVDIVINSPIDIDIDVPGEFGNKGLAFPNPNSYQSLFSGQYKIILIENIFSAGKFEQKIELVRYLNSSLISSFPQGEDASGAVKQNIREGQNSSPRNNSTTAPVISPTVQVPIVDASPPIEYRSRDANIPVPGYGQTVIDPRSGTPVTELSINSDWGHSPGAPTRIP